MTAKTPESPKESGPSTAASSSAPAPVAAKGAEPATVPTPAQPATTASAATAAPAAKAEPAASVPPAKPPAGRPPSATKPRGNGLAGTAFVMAVFAVLVALGATAVALYSLDQAREAKSKTADTAASRPGVSTSTAGAPAEAPAATPASTPTTPRAQFVPDANRAELKIPPPDGCASIFVDIDTMMVGTFNGHEFYLSSCLGPTAFRIDKTAGAVPTTGNPTPEVCAAQVSGANTGSELVLQARAGLTFCLLTNKDDATRQSIPQRIAIVEVRDVGLDKSVTVVVSTYRVPNQVA